MLHEFALEPDVLSNWQSFRYLVEKFGVPHGRMISRFPAEWKRLVYEACHRCRDIERKRIEESLRNINDKLLRSNRGYDENKSWFENAEDQHALDPFHAIIARINPRSRDGILIADDLDETTSLWNVNRETTVPRKSAEMAACVAVLLKNSTEVFFIDPHFAPENSRYRKTLEKLIEVTVTGNSRLKRIEYHLKEKSTEEFFKKECMTRIPCLLPTGTEIVFIRWKQKDGGETLHPRYILTDLGGVRVEHGLDEGDDGETTDVSLLDQELYHHRWSDFQKETSCYDFVDEVRVVGTRKI